jgi:hypothetical protein
VQHIDYDLSVPTGRLHRGFFDGIARISIWAWDKKRGHKFDEVSAAPLKLSLAALRKLRGQ